MKLLEMTTHDVAEKRPRLAFWAVGTIEAHDLGPLGTDVIAPETLVGDLADAFGALVLPTLPYGLVSSLAGYPGSMWMGRRTYESMIVELASSLRLSGVQEIVIFNGHGGNSSALGSVLPTLWKEHDLKAALIDWWAAAGDLSTEHFGAAGGHGGADELALVRAANPELVPETWDGSRAYRVRSGARACPSPRPAITYDREPPKPMTAESAQAYYTAVVERVRETVRDILAGWQAVDALRGNAG